MKTALGYFCLALGATFAGVALTVIYFILTGQGHTLYGQLQAPLHRIAMIIYGVFHVLAIFPLFYFGLKWIKKEPNTLPPKNA